MQSGEQQVPFLRLWYVSVQEQIRYLLISERTLFLAYENTMTWTDGDEAEDYVVPNVLSPRDLVFRPDLMDETVTSSSSSSRTQCADQQCSNLTVDQRLCYRYIDVTSPCSSFIRNSKYLAILYGCTTRFMFTLIWL